MWAYLIHFGILLLTLLPICSLISDAFRVSICANTTSLINVNYDFLSILISFQNFKNIFQFYYLYAIFISTILGFLTALLLIPFSTVFLYNIKDYKNKSLLFNLMILPYFIPFLVKTYMWVYISEYYLSTIFSKSVYTLLSTVLFCCYSHMPLTVLLINDPINQIHPDIFDAALDLGCTKSQMFYKILIPSIKNKLKGIFAIIFIMVSGEFIFLEIISSGSFPTIGSAISEEVLFCYDTPLASALTIIMLLWCCLFLGILYFIVK